MPARTDEFNPVSDRLIKNQNTLIEITETMSVALGQIATVEESFDGAVLMKSIAVQTLVRVQSLADSLDVVVKEKSEVANA